MDNIIIILFVAAPIVFIASTVDVMVNGPKMRNIVGLLLPTFLITTMFGGNERNGGDGF